MKNSLICGLLLILACLPASSFGAKVSGLYEAEVKVFSQKRSERSLAMISALAEVLAKASGQRDAFKVGNVSKAAKRPARYLQQYSYRALSDEERQRDLDSANPGAEPQIVLFRFDKAAVDKLLRDNDLPVWGSTRPATLVWLAVEDEGRQYMVGSDSIEPLRKQLLRESRRRGLAALLPLMDLQDQGALSFSDVWGGLSDSINQASLRYKAEAVMVGRLYRPRGGEWQGQWTLMENGTLQSWRGVGVLPGELLDEGVAGAIDVLASRYAPAAGLQTGFLPVTVTSVRNLDDYARVSRYLKSLQQVSQLHTSRVEADRITFELDMRGSPESFSKTVSLGNILTPYQALPGETGEAAVSWASSFSQVYQLLP